MALMGELFDKTFGAVVVKMLFEKIINTMETNGKNAKSAKQKAPASKYDPWQNLTTQNMII